MTDLLLLRYPTKGAAKAVNRQAKRLPDGFRQALDELTDQNKQELIDATPEGETKRLKRGWRVRKSGRGGIARSVIYNTQWYLGLVLKGTPAHTIEATHKILSGPRAGQSGYLRFPSRNGGFAFRRIVHHPGTKPNPFHRAATRRAAQRASGPMKKILVRTLAV